MRVYFYVPPNGFGPAMSQMQLWLDRQLGRGNCAWHGGGSDLGRDRVAVYFKHPVATAEFADAFSAIEVADGTNSPVYTSPDLTPRQDSQGRWFRIALISARSVGDIEVLSNRRY